MNGGPNWGAIAYHRKRPGQTCMRAGTYRAVDVVTGVPWRDDQLQMREIDMEIGGVFPMLPWKGLAWQRIGGDDEPQAE
jgi:hypothetical protein